MINGLLWSWKSSDSTWWCLWYKYACTCSYYQHTSCCVCNIDVSLRCHGRHIIYNMYVRNRVFILFISQCIIIQKLVFTLSYSESDRYYSLYFWGPWFRRLPQACEYYENVIIVHLCCFILEIRLWLRYYSFIVIIWVKICIGKFQKNSSWYILNPWQGSKFRLWIIFKTMYTLLIDKLSKTTASFLMQQQELPIIIFPLTRVTPSIYKCTLFIYKFFTISFSRLNLYDIIYVFDQIRLATR
jgi:hypothetical protein